MAVHTLTDLYVDELKDLYSAERQILKALPRMASAATHNDLKHAFENHRLQTETHIARLEKLFSALSQSPTGKTCRSLEGIIEEAEALIAEDPEPAVLDAGLIAAAQRVEHYEIAVYGAVCALAEQLGHLDQAAVLRQTLTEEQETDIRLRELATLLVNPDAVLAILKGRGADDTRRRASDTAHARR